MNLQEVLNELEALDRRPMESPCINCRHKTPDHTCLVDRNCDKPARYADSLGHPTIGTVPTSKTTWGRKTSQSSPVFFNGKSSVSWYTPKNQQLAGVNHYSRSAERVPCKWPHGCDKMVSADSKNGFCTRHQITIRTRKILKWDEESWLDPIVKGRRTCPIGRGPKRRKFKKEK